MTRRAAFALLIWAALMAVGVAQILRTSFTADLSAFLPDNPDAQQRVLIEQLQSGLPARTLLIAIDGGSDSQRAQASAALAQRLRASGLFEQVQNGQNDGFAQVGQWLVEHRYQLSPAINTQRFSAAGLRDGIEDTLSLLGTPAGGAIKPLLERDPTGETVRIAESLIPSNAPRSVEGVWASRQGERALLVTVAKAPGADLDAQQATLDAVRQAFAALGHERAGQGPSGASSGAVSNAGSSAGASATVGTNSAPGAPGASDWGLTLKISGAPLFGVESRAQIQTEVHQLAIAGTVLMGALLLVAFASLPALLVAMLPVATGVVAGIAAVSLVFGGVHGITLAFGTTLIGEAVDYAIYYLIQARAHGAAHWLRSGWPTIRLGLLTSICGFAALGFSGFPGLAQLGVFSVAGLIAAALFTRWVLPPLLPHGARGQGLRQQLGRFAAAAVDWLPRLRWPVLALGLASVVLLVQRSELWTAQLSSLSPISKEALALDASLRADLSAGDAKTLVVVQGADLQAVLTHAEAAGAGLEALVEQGAIGGYDSVARWLPSLTVQRQRLASLPAEAELRLALNEATRGGPLAAQRLEPFVADLQAARQRDPVTLDALRSQGLSPLLDALLLQRADGSWSALLPLQPAGNKLDISAVRQAVQTIPGAQVLEVGAELTRLYQRYLREAQNQALLGALGVVGLIAFSLRSIKRVLAVCQPLLLSVLLTMGLLAALGVQLGILHLVGLLLVVAVGSNYALFFDMLQRVGQTDPDTLASLLLANLTTVLSFGLIAFSGIPALSAVGRVVAVGALLALVLSAALVPRRVTRPAAST